MLFPAKTILAAVAAALTLAVATPRGPMSQRIRMDGNRFTPSEFKASPGDTLLFSNGNGGPHNVEFLADSMAAPSRKLFEKAMSGGKYKLGPTSSPLVIDANEVYKVVVPDVPAGRYAFICVPHQAQMRGALVVER
jgi:plastocyanin